MNITAPQLRRLQVLYKQYETHSLDTGSTREDRLTWAGARIGRTIASFNDLTLEEGTKLNRRPAERARRQAAIEDSAPSPDAS